MGVDIILDLLDKRSLEAQLVEPFAPDDGEVNVLVKGSGEVQKFFFPEICCVSMQYDQSAMFENLSDLLQEEVTTYSDKTYHVYVSEEQSYQTGFFGLSVQQDVSYRMIYFTKAGVKTRCQKRVVGEILQSRGLISADSIQIALKEQQMLKKQQIGTIISDNNALPKSVVEETLKDAIKSKKVPRGSRIGEILVAYGLITQEQVEEALAIKKKNERKKIGELLIELGYISEENLLAALATKFRIRIVDLSNLVPNMKALAALSYDVVHRLNVFPVADRGDRLCVATSQPTEYTIEEHLRFYTGRKIEMVIATTAQISAAIDKYYPSTAFVLGVLSDDLSVDQEVDNEGEAEGLTESDSQIVNIVNKILIDAYQQRASDIHFEPGFRDAPFNVRYRIDGICHGIHQIPLMYKKAMISRLKIMANLDITERRKPQSGKILLNYQSNRVEYRIEITPTTGNNEDAVLRILASSKPLPLDQMGFSADNLNAFRATLAQPYGIILCVGPTGSGKTTTLHSALAHLNTPERKIWTAEDPVEITQSGLRQVQIQSKIGLTFAEVLRSFLRADPDVIMIGEMRDPETAKTAIEASLTGHLVLSTLHTNSAPETIVRLIEMGMDPYNFADALLCIVAQRLARKLCDHCKKSYHPTAEEYANIVQLYDPDWFHKHNMKSYSRDVRLMRKEGCDQCNGTGYKGRLAIHEIAMGTESLKTAIKKGALADELRLLAIQEGMRTLLMDGIMKIFQGLTDVDQVLKVCSSQTICDYNMNKSG
jgi:type II secretory ATPase GspE/PulE/Tfp pilus assembly ATPase PilB-like protein